jgi:hypothetical protein
MNFGSDIELLMPVEFAKMRDTQPYKSATSTA